MGRYRAAGYYAYFYTAGLLLLTKLLFYDTDTLPKSRLLEAVRACVAGVGFAVWGLMERLLEPAPALLLGYLG